MKAATYCKGGASGKTVDVTDLPAPVPKDDEVLIRVIAASVNALDWRMKSRRPGVDVAGRVEAVGKKVDQFKPGDAVFGLGNGAFAEFSCARSSAVIFKPDFITYEQAASLPVAGLTALQSLRKCGHLQPGQSVLINGAAGAVGTFSVQIARALGGRVTGVCSSRNVEQTLMQGAERVIDYAREDFTKSPEHFDLLIDNVGNRTIAECRRILTPRGRCVMIGAKGTLATIFARLVHAYAFSLVHRQKITAMIASRNLDDLKFLCNLIRDGKLTPLIERQYPLAETGAAIAYVEGGHARAKVVVTMQ